VRKKSEEEGDEKVERERERERDRGARSGQEKPTQCCVTCAT
jgi:hypothetical protein